MRTLILVCLLFGQICAYSQESFVKGYVVKVSGDTVRGYLKRDVDPRLASGVYFQNDLYSKSSAFQSPKEITTFAFDKGNTYRAITYTDMLDGQSKTEFGKFLVEGEFNLYALAKGRDYFYYIKNANDTGHLLFGDVYNRNGSVAQHGNFRSVLNDEAKNCAKLQSRVSSIGYQQEELIKFVTELNQCNGMASTQVHYKKSRNEAHFVLYAGGMSIGGDATYTIQGQVRLISPGVSKRTSIITGLSYSRVIINEYSVTESGYRHFNTDILSVPFLFQYNFTERRFQPLAYVGISLAYKKLVNPDIVDASGYESDYGVAIVGGIGFEYFPINRLAIKADWRYEFTSHMPTLGLAYKFN